MHRLAFGQKFVFSAIINIHLEFSYKCNKFNNKREKLFLNFFSLYSSFVIELVTPLYDNAVAKFVNLKKMYFHNLAVHFKSFIVSEMGLIANPKGNRPLTATSLPTLNNARKHFRNSETK